MSLPDLIEIVPLSEWKAGPVTVPGSKSITNRALVLAALAAGETTLEGALWSEDTQVMVECLQELGFMVTVSADRAESSNRRITVYGQGGTVPRGGTREQPLELFVGNAGTAARFLMAMVCLGEGAYRLHGVKRMHERPQEALVQALRALGYQLDTPNNRLPVTVHGHGPRRGRCEVSIEDSSQFASALLLAASRGGWEIKVTGENAEESPYVAMTVRLVERISRRPGCFEVEPDSSSGSYFWGAWWLFQDPEKRSKAGPSPLSRAEEVVAHWPQSTWQIDSAFPSFLPLPKQISRRQDLGDSIMTAIVLAPFADHPVRFTELGRLRVQECERVKALKTELTRCGAAVIEDGDTLTVVPGNLHGATIETYQDHRMAMCFAILGLKVPGIKIKNPDCVKKTFPNFFQKLAAAPPHGLGATILDGQERRPLAVADLGAEEGAA